MRHFPFQFATGIFGLLFLLVAPLAAQNHDAAWDAPSEIVTPPPDEGQIGTAYTIVKDDCLWDISFRFLGDPFRWPEIWHLNSYIVNPDLIYPGNPLHLPGRTAVSSAHSAGNQQLVSQTAGALQAALPAESGAQQNNFIDSGLLAELRNRNPFAPGFFAGVPYLWTQRDVAGNIYPGNGIVEKPGKRESYQRFDEMRISLMKGASYQAGDTVDIITSVRFVKFNNETANLVKRVGRAVVRRSEGKTVFATITEMWDVIKGKERVAKTEYFVSRQIDTLIHPEIVVSGMVFARVENTESPYPYQSFIVDRGTNDGVAMGDIFAISEAGEPGRASGSPSHPRMLGCAAHVDTKHCTMVIIRMFDNQLNPGDHAVLLKRTQFSAD